MMSTPSCSSHSPGPDLGDLIPGSRGLPKMRWARPDGPASCDRFMTIRRVLSLLLGFCVVSLTVGTAAADAPVPASPAPEGPIGQFAGYLKERAGPLGLERAVAAFLAGAYLPGRAPVLHGGIGAAPTWVHSSVNNPSDRPLPRRLSVETAWLDRAEVYLRVQTPDPMACPST